MDMDLIKEVHGVKVHGDQKEKENLIGKMVKENGKEDGRIKTLINQLHHHLLQEPLLHQLQPQQQQHLQHKEQLPQLQLQQSLDKQNDLY